MEPRRAATAAASAAAEEATDVAVGDAAGGAPPAAAAAAAAEDEEDAGTLDIASDCTCEQERLCACEWCCSKMEKGCLHDAKSGRKERNGRVDRARSSSRSVCRCKGGNTKQHTDFEKELAVTSVSASPRRVEQVLEQRGGAAQHEMELQ